MVIRTLEKQKTPMTSILNTPAEIQDAIVQEFEAFQDWDARYKHIIDLGKRLPPFPEEYRLESNEVKGCQSKVWMHASLEADETGQPRVHYVADSDALIVRGLVALILRLYSGQSPDVVMKTPPAFIERINMGQHISMQRSNGLHAMIKQMKLYALALQMKANVSS